jgi:hypothetical protein
MMTASNSHLHAAESLMDEHAKAIGLPLEKITSLPQIPMRTQMRSAMR